LVIYDHRSDVFHSVQVEFKSCQGRPLPAVQTPAPSPPFSYLRKLCRSDTASNSQPVFKARGRLLLSSHSENGSQSDAYLWVTCQGPQFEGLLRSGSFVPSVNRRHVSTRKTSLLPLRRLARGRHTSYIYPSRPTRPSPKQVQVSGVPPTYWPAPHPKRKHVRVSPA